MLLDDQSCIFLAHWFPRSTKIISRNSVPCQSERKCYWKIGCCGNRASLASYITGDLGQDFYCLVLFLVKILIEFFNYIIFHTTVLLGEHVNEVVLVSGKWRVLQR